MARLVVSDSEDQSAAVWIVSLLLLPYKMLTTLVRGFIKLKIMGFDDGVASLAQLLTYGNVSSVMYALHYGLARSTTRTEDDHVELDYGKVDSIEQIP